MQKQMLYRDLAKYYDLLYSDKQYAREAARLKKLIAKYRRSQGNELLDIACGTGSHIKHLKDQFQCTGVDVSPAILALAKRNVPNAMFLTADMTTLNLGKTFDVITCLFGSIGYVITVPRLRGTIYSFARHLRMGGVLIIEPWLTKAAYRDGSVHMTTYSSEMVKIARLTVSRLRGNLSIIDMHYLIAEKDKRVTHSVDRHELGLFETDQTLQILKEAGLETRFVKNGLLQDRGLFIGVKTQS